MTVAAEKVIDLEKRRTAWTKWPNEMLERLVNSPLMSHAGRVLCYVMRYTVGYHREEIADGAGKIRKATGLRDLKSVRRAISDLVAAGFITVRKDGPRKRWLGVGACMPLCYDEVGASVPLQVGASMPLDIGACMPPDSGGKPLSDKGIVPPLKKGKENIKKVRLEEGRNDAQASPPLQPSDCSMVAVDGNVDPAEPVLDGLEKYADRPGPNVKKQPRRKCHPKEINDEYLSNLQAQECYHGINVRHLYQKMVNWCEEKGKKPTRSRLINWLNREDPDPRRSGNFGSYRTENNRRSNYRRPGGGGNIRRDSWTDIDEEEEKRQARDDGWYVGPEFENGDR